MFINNCLEIQRKSNGALESELDGVSNQIEQHLLVTFLVSLHYLRHIGRYGDEKIKFLLGSLELHDVVYILDGVSQIELFFVDLELIVLKSAHIQCVFNHVLKKDG